ncbi:MAG: ATP-binding protein [Desulfobacterales bacterium]|nr:ATP-binding protein [Desulfobacterales bacterium]
MNNTGRINTTLNTDDPHAVAPMLLRSIEAGGFFRANDSFLSKVGVSEAELAEQPFLHWIESNDIIDAKLTIQGKQSACWVAHKCRGGAPLPLRIRVVENDGETFVLGRSEEEAGPMNGPEDSDDEATIRGTLHTIARIIEAQNPGYKCSILLVADGRFVRGAGPSLPEAYNAAIDGHAIGPAVGSCGTAIYWNVPVITGNIQTDPLWKPFAELAKKAGVAACWSHPFSSTTGNVLGALALYAPVPRMPTREQLGRLEAAARITGLAVERGRAEEALRLQHKRELELEAQLHQAKKMESLGNLAGGIAHEFNNILSIIIGNTELIIDEISENSLARESADDIIVAGMRASEVVKQLLTFSRQDNASKKALNIRSVVIDSMKLIRSSTPTNIEISLNLSEDVSPIFGNVTQINQLLFNLCSNAVDAMPDMGGLLTVDLSNETIDENSAAYRRSVKPGHHVRLAIGDNGIGMDNEIVEKIFDPYYTTKDIGKGTGIGLAVVQGIVERHGGVIILDSNPDKGTTFTIYLPAHDGLPENEDEGQSVLPTGEERVLYVDDEPSIAKLGERHLNSLGYTAESTTDPLQALEMIKTDPDRFDLIISDIAMPNMTGDHLLAEIFEIRPDIPAIICTGYSAIRSEEEAGKIGSAAFLMKPLDKAELAKTVRKVLDDAQKEYGPAEPVPVTFALDNSTNFY